VIRPKGDVNMTMHWKRTFATVVATAAILGMGLATPLKAEARGDHDHDHDAFGPRTFIGGSFAARPYFGVGLGFGPYWGGYWGPYWSSWWGPWGSPYWGPYPYYPETGPSLGYAMINGYGAIDMHVKPNQAEVWVDGSFVAEARNLDGTPTYLWLKTGDHEIQVYEGGYVTVQRKIDVRAGTRTDLNINMEKGVSVPPGTQKAQTR
jgi:hypothetical protein